jgi:PPOX class probable F420-dependent enzyme
MVDTLSPAALALLEQPVVAHLATVGPDGWPHVTPVWVDHDGGDVLINTAQGRRKARDLQHDDRVAVSVTARDDPMRAVALRGRVVEVTTDGADEHIDRLAGKYLGVDRYPYRGEGEVRLKVRIRPERVVMQPAEG